MKKLQTSCIVLFFLTLIQPSVVHVIGSCTLWWLSVAFILTEAGFHTLFTPKVKLAGVQWPLWTPPPPPPSLSQPPPSTPCGLLLRLCKQLNIQWPTPHQPPGRNTKAAFTSTFWWPSEGNVVVAGCCLLDTDVHLCIVTFVCSELGRGCHIKRNVRCWIECIWVGVQRWSVLNRVTYRDFFCFHLKMTKWNWCLCFVHFLHKVLKSM